MNFDDIKLSVGNFCAIMTRRTRVKVSQQFSNLYNKEVLTMTEETRLN